MFVSNGFKRIPFEKLERLIENFNAFKLFQMYFVEIGSSISNYFTKCKRKLYGEIQKIFLRIIRKKKCFY